MFVFDWDIITISGNATSQLSSKLNLCVDYLPCTLWLRGEAHGTVEVSGLGQIVCLSSADCSKITIQSVTFTCSNNTKSVFKMQGSTLIISGSAFTSCQADSDGGVVQAYDMAEVDIEASHFADIVSSGFGGAVAAYGSNLFISNSWLHNCTSRGGGGAVWASAFQDCYGSNLTQNTQLSISSSMISSCSTFGAGGAILAESGESLGGEVLDVAVSYSHFYQCTSKAEGGAVRITGAFVAAHLQHTNIESCISDAAGGAISSSASSSLSLIACTMHNNSAQGMGGGALHLNKSYFGAFNTSIRNNRAPWGGGGALLWQGWVKLAAVDCPMGTERTQDSCTSEATDRSFCDMGSCAPCTVGTYSNVSGSSVCRSCPPGTFSTEEAAQICTSCLAGSYSSADGANRSSVCVYCDAGTYSDEPGLSVCRSCPPGTYSFAEDANSSQICTSCLAGTYSSVDGANRSSVCVYCGAGTYSDEPGLSVCRSCPPGTYSSAEDANSSQICTSCLAGTYSSLNGANSSSVCVNCVADTYSATPGSTFCISCPKGQCNNLTTNRSGLGSCNPCPSFSRSYPELFAGAKITLSAPRSFSSFTPMGSNRKSQSNKENLFRHGYQGKKMPKTQDHALVSTLSLFYCSFEQQRILEVLASVSIDTIDGLERFFSRLRLKTKASSSKEAIELVLDDDYFLSKKFGFKKKLGASSGTGSQRKKLLRGAYFNTHAENSLPGFIPSNVLNRSVQYSLSLCAENNSALYGPFIASDFWKLQVSEVETVFTGVPFNFTVAKRDAYGNLIRSDSSSVVEASPVLNGTEGVDQSTTILGSAVSKMSGGVATFLFAVKAAFSSINYGKQSVSLSAPTLLSITGQDQESGVQMESGLVPVHVQQGVSVCPLGYILVPDQANGSAICTLCRPASYSLSPLARSPDSSINSPSCLSCPVGCKCILGGTDIQCDVGLWRAVEGVFRVVSCPAGSQLINSTAGTSQGIFSNDLQQCKACLPGQYIINPDTDECQECPQGSQQYSPAHQ